MRIVILTILCLSFTNFVKANSLQDTTHKKNNKEHHKKVVVDSVPPKNWKIHGSNSISGNQSTFSNWQLGGTGNITVDIRLNYDINYQKDKWSLDNKLIAKYGFNKNKEHSLKKTEDGIELNSILARQFDKRWHYSFFFNFKSQFDKGLDPKDPKTKVSHFMSPIFLMAGPGIFWKKNDDFKINLSPASPRFVLVHSHFTKMGKSYGVDKGEIHKFEVGATAYIYYKFHIMKNVSMENIFEAFSNYLYKPQNIDFNYQGSLYFKVNNFISANVFYDALYDNDIIGKLQQKQSVGIGLKYTLEK